MSYCFDSFDIRWVKTHVVSDPDEVDRMVCEKFGLEAKEHDFGHYHVPEAKDPNERWNQESISWVGLLHCIVFYSNIGHGYRNTYEILGALEGLRQGIGSQIIIPKFPLSIISFVAKLLDFLQDHGLYIYVNYNDSFTDNNVYEDLTHTFRRKFYKTCSGYFECDEDGTLLRFYPDLSGNFITRTTTNYWNKYPVIYLKHFKIPEGVTSFSYSFLKEGWTSENICFPDTFKSDNKEINIYALQEMAKILEKPLNYSLEDIEKLVANRVCTEKELMARGLLTCSLQKSLEAYNKLPNPFSIITERYYRVAEECTDVYFLGNTGTGKTCLLAGLVGADGCHELSFDYNQQAGLYAKLLKQYVEKGVIPPYDVPSVLTFRGKVEEKTTQNRIIDHNFNIILPDGSQFETFCNKENVDARTTRLSEWFCNQNRKIFFLIVDPTIPFISEGNLEYSSYQRQEKILSMFVNLFEAGENKELMKRVDAIHFIVTKADTLADTQEERSRQAHTLLTERYSSVVHRLVHYCKQTKRINHTTDYRPRIYTYSLGKFYLKDAFEYDSKDSLYLIKALCHMTYGRKEPTSMNKIFKPMAVVRPKHCDYGFEIHLDE